MNMHNYKPHSTIFALDASARENNRWHDAEEIIDHIARSSLGERYEDAQPRRFALDRGGLSFDVASECSVEEIRNLASYVYSFVSGFCGVEIETHVWSCDAWVNSDPEDGDGTCEGDDEYRVVVFFKAV